MMMRSLMKRLDKIGLVFVYAVAGDRDDVKLKHEAERRGAFTVSDVGRQWASQGVLKAICANRCKIINHARKGKWPSWRHFGDQAWQHGKSVKEIEITRKCCRNKKLRRRERLQCDSGIQGKWRGVFCAEKKRRCLSPYCRPAISATQRRRRCV